MKILIIEDNKIKIERLSSFLKENIVVIKESFHSGLKELLSNHETYDLLILDMSLPLWENSENIDGIDEQFAGENILREMKRKKINTPTVLMTMFDFFDNGRVTFNQVNDKFEKRYQPFYKGAIFYDASKENWKNELSYIIKNLYSTL